MAATLSTLATTIQAPVNYILMRGLLSAARKKLPFFNGSLPGKLEIAQGSASVKWRRINNLTAATTALSELNGTASAFLGRSFVQPTISDVTVAIAKYGNAIGLTEEVDLFNVNSNSMQLMDTLGANAGESLNTLMATVYNNETTKRFGGNVAAASLIITAVSVNDIKYCVNQLNRNSARVFEAMGTGSTNIGTSPIRSSYYGICHPDVEEDIRALTGFIAVEQYGGYTETLPFEFGTIAGVRFCISEITPISTSAGKKTATNMRGTSNILNDVYSTFIYGQEAVGTIGLGEEHAKEIYEMYDPSRPPAVELIHHPVGSSGVYDPYNEVGSIAWKSWFAGKTLNSNWIAKLQTLSNKLI